MNSFRLPSSSLSLSPQPENNAAAKSRLNDNVLKTNFFMFLKTIACTSGGSKLMIINPDKTKQRTYIIRFGGIRRPINSNKQTRIPAAFVLILEFIVKVSNFLRKQEYSKNRYSNMSRQPTSHLFTNFLSLQQTDELYPVTLLYVGEAQKVAFCGLKIYMR